MLFKKQYSFLVRSFFPASLNPNAGDMPAGTLLAAAFPYIAKAPSIESGAEEARNRAVASQGTPFMVCHIPGKHTLDQLSERIKQRSAEMAIVWEDQSMMKVFDLVVDYCLGGKSLNDRLKLKTYTIEDAILVARSTIVAKGGLPCAILHILGDNSLETLKSVAEGRSTCVTRLVWYDEDESISSMTEEDILQGFAIMDLQTPADKLAQRLLYETRGPNAPGILLPHLLSDQSEV